MDQVSSVTADERRRVLDQIAAEVATCTRCPLAQERTLAVPGEGHPDTEVVFVGEGPGYNEDQQGRPFVGAAGTLLNDLLKQIGWKRQDVFITNVVKCRPPGNRDPEPHEIAACAPYLKRQLEVLDPAVIVTLGRHSLGHFNPGARIGQTHGTVAPVDAETGAGAAVTYAMYHPAAALRQGSLKQTMLADMANLPQVLLDARARRKPADEAVPVVAAVPMEADEPALVPVGGTAIEEAFPVAIDEAVPALDENQMQMFGA
jgi:DNA polymerase